MGLFQYFRTRINDAVTSLFSTWSSSKIEAEIAASGGNENLEETLAIGNTSGVQHIQMTADTEVRFNTADNCIKNKSAAGNLLNFVSNKGFVFDLGSRQMAFSLNALVITDSATNETFTLDYKNGSIVWNDGGGNSQNINFKSLLTSGNHFHNLQDKNGTLAHLDDIPAPGGFLTSTLTAPQIVANQNDYSPAGLAPNQFLRLSSSATVDITGIDSSGFSDRDILVILNVGNNTIRFRNDDPASAAANRLAISGNLNIQSKESITLIRDTTSGRWCAVGQYV